MNFLIILAILLILLGIFFFAVGGSELGTPTVLSGILLAILLALNYDKPSFSEQLKQSEITQKIEKPTQSPLKAELEEGNIIVQFKPTGEAYVKICHPNNQIPCQFFYMTVDHTNLYPEKEY